MCHTNQCVTQHKWMSQITQMKESGHTNERALCQTNKWVRSKIEWVTWHTWMNQVIHMNESGHTNEWITSRKRMSHGTLILHVRSLQNHLHEAAQHFPPPHTCPPPHTHEMSHLTHEMCHVTHMNESCHTWEPHIYTPPPHTHTHTSHVNTHDRKTLCFFGEVGWGGGWNSRGGVYIYIHIYVYMYIYIYIKIYINIYLHVCIVEQDGKRSARIVL